MIQGDAAAYFAYLPSLVLDGDLDLRNQFRTLRAGEGDPQRPFGGTESLAANPFPIGPAILWLPGYVVGLAVDWVLGVSDVRVGYGSGVALGTAAWSILLAGLGAEVTRQLVQRSLGLEYAFPSTVTIWIGTPCLYYTLVSPLYSHAIAWSTVSMMMWLAWRATQRGSGWAAWGIVGLVSGFVLAIRLQEAPLLLIPLALLAVSSQSSDAPGRMAKSSGAWCVGVLLGFLPQAITSIWLNGSLTPVDAPLSIPTLSDVFSVLFSTGYEGWISWTPIVLPAIMGLTLLARRSHPIEIRALAGAGMAAIVAMVLIDILHPFGPGAAYGGRRYVSIAPVLTLGVAGLLAMPVRQSLRGWKIVLPALCVWNLWLLTSYELLTIVHGVYPTLREATRHAVGLAARG